MASERWRPKQPYVTFPRFFSQSVSGVTLSATSGISTALNLTFQGVHSYRSLALGSWKQDQLADVEALLAAAIAEFQHSSRHVPPCHAYLRVSVRRSLTRQSTMIRMCFLLCSSARIHWLKFPSSTSGFTYPSLALSQRV